MFYKIVDLLSMEESVQFFYHNYDIYWNLY